MESFYRLEDFDKDLEDAAQGAWISHFGVVGETFDHGIKGKHYYQFDVDKDMTPLVHEVNEKVIKDALREIPGVVFVYQAVMVPIWDEEEGDIHPAFRRLHEFAMALASYPCLDDGALSESTLEGDLEQLQSALDRLVRHCDDAEDGLSFDAQEVYDWLNDHDQEALQHDNDGVTLAWLSDARLKVAVKGKYDYPPDPPAPDTRTEREKLEEALEPHLSDKVMAHMTDAELRVILKTITETKE